MRSGWNVANDQRPYDSVSSALEAMKLQKSMNSDAMWFAMCKSNHIKF